jgi:hypothetical protein
MAKAHNQTIGRGLFSDVRERPLAAAAAVAGVAAAGAFLWTRREQVGDVFDKLPRRWPERGAGANNNR